jgi:hypothetical protein
MPITVKPETEARISELAQRLGYTGPNAAEQVLRLALDILEGNVPKRRKMSPDEIRESMAYFREAGRRWREQNPYDDANPPSKVWQDELYDENGLPK